MTRIITVTSGKGGVGKTNISVNLALHLARLGYRTCLFDADLGLANINILLKLYPEYNLKDVILNHKTLDDVIIRDYQGIDIISGSSGVEKMVNLNPEQIQNLITSFSNLDYYDFFIIDTAAGISKNVLSFCLSSSEIMLVISTDPTSLTDAYALLKVLSLNGYKEKVMVVINQSPGNKRAKAAYRKLSSTSNKYLSIKLSPIGILNKDKHVESAVANQKPFISLYPNSYASKSIKVIAENLIKKESQGIETSGIDTFWEKCLTFFKSSLKGGNEKEEQKENKEIDLPEKNQEHLEVVEDKLKNALPKSEKVMEISSKSLSAAQISPEINLILNKVIEGISSITTELKSIKGLIKERKSKSGMGGNEFSLFDSAQQDSFSKSQVIDELVSQLADSSIFQTLDDNEIRYIVSHMKHKKLRVGDTIIQRSEKQKNIFIILSGKVDVLRDEGIVNGSLREKDVFGEQSLLGDYLSHATLLVSEPLHILYIKGEDFIRILRKYPPLLMYFARYLSKTSEKRFNNLTIPVPGLNGRLSDIPIPTLLQQLNGEKRTGVLSLRFAKGEGRLFLKKGDLVSAKYLNFQDREAFYEMLCEIEGTFKYQAGLPAGLNGKTPVGHFMKLVLEGLSQRFKANV